MQIRRIEPAEAAAFREIRLEGLRNHPTSFGADFDEEVLLPLSVHAERLAASAMFGAWLDGGLVAIAGLRREGGRKQQHYAIVWGVYVRPQARGKSAGAAVLDAVIAHARAEGLGWLKLVVEAGNARARNLYLSRGFVVYGREPAALMLDDVVYDDDLMALRLE